MSKILNKLNPAVNIIGNNSPPRSGAFEVTLNNQLIFSKLETGDFPQEEIIKTWLK